MKKPIPIASILIASIAPAFWLGYAIWIVGDAPAHREPGDLNTAGIVLAAAIMVIPCAAIGCLCGRASKGG